MTDGPAAKLGKDLKATLDRPRSHLAAARNPEYLRLRNEVIGFLDKPYEAVCRSGGLIQIFNTKRMSQ